MKRFSLVTRLSLLFALLSFVTTASITYLFYSGLSAQIRMRDDAALLTRADQIRTLVRDEDLINLIHTKPQLFANMLGNTESLLVLRFAGQAPLIEINPAGSAVPELTPVPAEQALALDAVHHLTNKDGTPFIFVAARAKGADPQTELEIVTGRLMTERTQVLSSYRKQLVLLALVTAVLSALLSWLLVRRGLGPLQTLAATASSIGMKNLSTRIDSAQAPNELLPLIDAFNQMLDRLDRGFAQLSQVSADMAHDLRTPISTMLGQIEVSLGQPRTREYYEKLLGSNFEELQRLSRMTDNMLFLARAEHADHAIERSVLDGAAEVARVCEYFEGPAEERNIALEAHGTGEVYADPTLLRRALANLVSNAVRYAEAGTAIAIRTEVADAGTGFTVENRGTTIASEHLTRLFDRFYRVDTSRNEQSGTNGLGLSIVRSIMSLHQGTWNATSADGITRFTIFFPKPVPAR